MEIIPPELVQEISRYLTPQDLAHCIAVSHNWRDIFDQDYLWKQHCDPALEDVLRTIPSVVQPVFVTPQVEGSTLPPICQWRLSLLRERHLWRNWRKNNCNIEELEVLREDVHREFLTDTLIVKWFSRHIEVWDVSCIPASFVAKTDPSVYDLDHWIDCNVVQKRLLVVEQKAAMKVLYVDIANKLIKLKHEISFDDVFVLDQDRPWSRRPEQHEQFRLNCIKGHILVHVNVGCSILVIFDLETGKKIKEEVCPVVGDGEAVLRSTAILTSETSDYVVVNILYADPPEDSQENCYYYIYCPEKLCFLSGPITQTLDVHFGGRMLKQHNEVLSIINGQYLAVKGSGFYDTTIYDCHSLEVLLKIKKRVDRFWYGPDGSFIWSQLRHDRFLTMFTPSNNCHTLTILCGFSRVMNVKTYNNKLVVGFDSSGTLCFPTNGSMWKMGKMHNMKINHLFTRALSQDTEIKWCVYHFW